MFYAQAEQLELDSQGRIRIPSSLLAWAGLEKDIVIVGVGFNWEIWDKASWGTYFSNHSTEFDWVHQATFEQKKTNGPEDLTSPPLKAK